MEFKIRFYNCYRELVPRVEIKEYIVRILIMISFFQIIKNQFWQLGLVIQNNGVLLQYIIQLTEFASLLKLVHKSNSEFFYEAIVFGLSVLLNFMFLIMIVYVWKSRKEEIKNAARLNALRNILMFWNILLPFFILDVCLEVFISSFICTDSYLIAGFLDKSSTDLNYCSSALRYVLVAVSIESILLLGMFAALNSTLFFDDSFNYNNALARSSNISSIYFLIIKIVNCTVALGSIYNYSIISTSGIFLGLFLIYSWILHSYHTYYNLPLADFDMTLSLYQIAISAVPLAQGISIEATSGKIIPSFVFFAYFLLSFRFARILSRKSFAFHIQRKFNISANPVGLDKKIKMLYTTFKYHREEARNQKQVATSQQHLECLGFLIKAVEDYGLHVLGPASEPNIIFDPLTKQLIDVKNASSSQKVMSLTYIKHLIKILYQQAIAFHPKSAHLRLGLANFLLFELQHIYLSILECIQIKRLINVGWSRQYQIRYFYGEIAKLFQDLNKNNEDDESWSQFDLERLLQIENNFQKLHGSLVRFFQFSKDLYDYILSERPSLSVLEQKMVAQLNNYAAIGEIFRSLNQNPRSIKLYAQFLREVMGDNKAGKMLEIKLRHLTDKLIQNRLAKQTLLDPDLAYNEDSTIVTIGGTRDNIGRIIKVNQGIEKLFGHKKEDLYMSNIKRLMPGVIADKHDTFLNNFLETSRMTILYKERMLYGRHKEGHIFCLNLLVKPMFDTTTNLLQFISFIQPLSQDADHIITDSSGLICGLSKNIAKTLKIDPLFLETIKVYFPSLAPKSLYLYLEEIEQQRTMKKKNSNKRQLSFKRIETDTKLINKSQEGEFLFHIYVSKHLLESSARLYNPQNPPESHELLKGNFEGSEVFKLRCIASDFECSDQKTRLKFFFVSEVEFIYKKKTKAAMDRTVSSYKTWNKLFFSKLKEALPNDSENPLTKIANAFKKNFKAQVEPETPGSPKVRKSKMRSTKFRALLVKAIKGGSQATIDKDTNEPESLETTEEKMPGPEKIAPQVLISNETSEKAEEKKAIIHKVSFENNIEKQDSMGFSYKKTLSSGNTLTAENKFRKMTSNELLPRTKFQHTLSPILSEFEPITQQIIEEESARERNMMLAKKSTSLIRGDTINPSPRPSGQGSVIGTKILSIANLVHWVDNTNRPNILDNPPANSDSYISEEEVEEIIKNNQENPVDKKQEEKMNLSHGDRIEFNSTPIGGLSISLGTEKKHTSISPSNTSQTGNQNSSKQDLSNNTESLDDQIVKKSDNSSILKRSMSIGTAVKFYTDHSKKFKMLLAKTKDKAGRIKGVKLGSVAKIMGQEKLRNLIENEGSLSSSSSKHSNTSKRFILSSIQHEYIPFAYFTFRSILYLCFIFLITSTIALALEESKKFNYLEENYDNNRNYVKYITQISKLGSSIYDLLYLQVNLYSSNNAQERSYLHDISVNKTLNSTRIILDNYSTVRTGNENYFKYSDDWNMTQLESYSFMPEQTLDLTQSIYEFCATGVYILSDLQNNISLDSMLSQYDYILKNTNLIVDHMSSKISLEESINVLRDNKTLSLLVLILCTLTIAILWLVAVRSIFKCFVELQKVLLLFVNLPSNDLIELRNIMDQALHTLQNDEFKYRPPVFKQSTKSAIRRFIPLHFPRVKTLGAGIILLILALLSYTLTIENSHAFDDTLQNRLLTASQIDIRMYEKYSWQQSLKNIFYYKTQGYSFVAGSNSSDYINELYENITDTFVQEADLLSQIDTFLADASTQTQNEINQLIQDNLCLNPSISINRVSYYPCAILFDDSLSEGYNSLLSSYANFLENNLRDILNNSPGSIQSEISEYVIQLPDLLDYMEAGDDFIQAFIRQQIFANFERSRWTTISVSILLCVIELLALPIVYFFFLNRLRARFIRVRRILGLVPFGFLARNPKIKRYLQQTSASMTI